MKSIFLVPLILIVSSCSIISVFNRSANVTAENSAQKTVHPEIEGMAFVPGGWFMMGSNKKKNEQPVHKVFIEGFYMDKTEVTVSEYRRFAEQTSRKMPAQPEWNFDSHPVVNVSWEDANAYASWIGKRLPTEAEWEYVARGGDNNYEYVFQNSKQYGRNYENIADESMRTYNYHFPVVNGYDDGYVFTSPVGLFAPNKFNIHDLNGNVLEWCSDWYKDSYDLSSDPSTPDKGNYKVIRGASWNRSGNYMRAAFRTFYNYKVRFDFVGFRCVKDAELPITQNIGH
ncbi:MAG: formylglycine-generating enzyme family protein [Calditrichaeota bacterium]|nr:formylglycine-generating enzyme family protein [Calditrichota bacterium]